MEINISDTVLATKGRDQGKYFLVTGLEDGYALIVDGKGRRLEKPKRKKLKHLLFVESGESRTALKIRNGERVTNSEVRRTLSDFTASNTAEGGM